MDIKDCKNIWRHIESISEEKKKIVVLSLAAGLQPLVKFYQKQELTKYINNVLDELWENNNDIVEFKYRQVVDSYFSQEDYDEYSYKSFRDPNFKAYLAFKTTEILACYFKGETQIFCDAAFNMFLEINEVLDEFEYSMNKDNITIDAFSKVSQRIMVNASKILLTNILTEISNNNKQSKYNLTLRMYIEEYSASLNKVIHLN